MTNGASSKENRKSSIDFWERSENFMSKKNTATEAAEYRFRFDEMGRIHVRNLSAYWIPELTVTEEIGGTVYTVTGSYEGTENFLRRLERITAKNFTETMEVGR